MYILYLVHAGPGSSDSSCSDVYRGPEPLSELELTGVTCFLMEKNRTNGVHLFMDFHSYGQYWLYPWGYTGDKHISVPNVDAMVRYTLKTEMTQVLSPIS